MTCFFIWSFEHGLLCLVSLSGHLSMANNDLFLYLKIVSMANNELLLYLKIVSMANNDLFLYLKIFSMANNLIIMTSFFI